MLVKLTVVNEEDEESSPSDYLFEGERVTIGRGEENDLTIADPKRIVSTEHAAVQREGRAFHLIDRGSKNFTYVGTQRITSQNPFELSDGDVFQIGDFRIEFRTLEVDARATGGGETVFDHEFANPFETPVERLLSAISELEKAYEETPAQRRDDALDAALETVGGECEHEAIRRVLATVGSSASSPASTEGGTAEETPSGGSDASPSTSVGGADPVQGVVDVLASALARVIRIPWRFRHEFIGQTVMQAPETQFLYSGDGETIKEHLLDPALAAEEREERLEYVEEAAEALLVHQIAMLNGYKASVMEGAADLIDRLDPEGHREAVEAENPLLEYLPVFCGSAALDRLRAAWDELQQGDGTVAEERVFRPAFTKAYLARMTAPPSSADERSEDDG